MASQMCQGTYRVSNRYSYPGGDDRGVNRAREQRGRLNRIRMEVRE